MFTGPLLACQAGLETYSLPLSAVASIARGERLARNTAGNDPLGWLADGGTGEDRHTPIWSLSALLGTQFEVQAEAATLLVFDSEAGPWGLAVDRVHRSDVLRQDELLPLPGFVARPHHTPFLGVVGREHGLSLLLDPHRLDPRRERPAPPSHNGSGPHPPPTEGLLEPRSPESPLAGTRRIVIFSTAPGGEAPVLFALSLSQVEEVLRPQPLLKVPGAEPFFLGLVPWRREAVPILDLSLRMGAGPSFFEGESRFLIARGARRREWLGFAVRPEIRMIELPVPNRPSQRGRLLDRSLVRGVFELDAGTVFFPDVDRFLAG